MKLASGIIGILSLGAPAVTSALELHGSGTTNPSKFFWEVIAILEARAKKAVRITYRAVGSGAGQTEFIGADNSYAAYSDFGSGDMPIGNDDYQTLMDQSIEVMHFPFVLGAMSFFHNIPELPKSGSNGLNMTACLLARIFTTDIATWDHEDILAINPSLSVPSGQAISVFHRTYSSSTTTGITTYLRAGCPAHWGADLVGSTIDWDASTTAVEGSGEMSSMISSTEYGIGYIDSGHGHDDGLSEIELENSEGLFQSSLEAIPRGGVALAASKAVENNVVPSDPLKSFGNVSLHNMAGDITWPIVAVSYVYLRKDMTAAGSAGPLLKAFLDFVISEEGQALAETYGFVGIPQAMLDVAQAAIDALALDPEEATWSFEESTTAGTGQGDTVFSVKRRSYYEYALGNVEGDFEALAETAAANEAAIAALQANVDMYHDEEEGHNDDDDDHHKSPAMPIAVAGLVFALVALILAAVALKKVMDMEKERQNHQSFRAEMTGKEQI